MIRSRMHLWGLLAIVATAVAACAGSSAATSSGPPSNRQQANACDRKLVTADDLTSVLAGAIAEKTLAGDPQTCEFSTPDYSSVSVTVRAGLGDVTVTQWTNGGVPVSSVPVSGIGDRAVWQGTLKELIATKHNVLCDIGSQGAKGTEADLQKTFGQLCDKIWAAQ